MTSHSINLFIILSFIIQVYDKNQSKYLVHFAVGVISMGVSVFAFSQQVFMNSAPKHLLKN